MSKAIKQAIEAVKIGVAKPKPRINGKKIHPFLLTIKTNNP